MSDILYLSALDGNLQPHSLFGKNSGRNPDEAQTLVLLPRRQPSPSIRSGSREIPRQDKGYSCILSVPEGESGGEMGLNEKGVAIGNTEVFSRFQDDSGPLDGADILRAVLFSCGNAKEAVDFICGLAEEIGPGGKGEAGKGLNGNRKPHDSAFLVSDPSGAFIVETAGRRWAWRAAENRDAISDAYCISDDYKRLDPLTRKEIAPVNGRAACCDETDAGRKGSRESFRNHVEIARRARMSRGYERREASLSLLRTSGTKDDEERADRGGGESKGGLVSRLDIAGFLDILRSHAGGDPGAKGWNRLLSLCAHPGIFSPMGTTASFAVEYLGEGQAIAWFAGTPCPCLSLFKPVLLTGGEFIPLWKKYDYSEGSEASKAYWTAGKAWIGREGHSRLSLEPEFRAGLLKAQRSLAQVARKALSSCAKEGRPAVNPVFIQEVSAIVAGWEKDRGMRKPPIGGRQAAP